MWSEVSAKVKELPGLKTHQLRELWLELFAKPPHPKLRRDLMIPILAYQIQENVYGGLKSSTRKRLKSWRQSSSVTPTPNFGQPDKSKPEPNSFDIGKASGMRFWPTTRALITRINATEASPKSPVRSPVPDGRALYSLG